jgi:diacylglycerol kinase (ATP)
MVLTAELLNTAIEYLTDFVSPEHNLIAGKVKDIASAAVFITALCSAIIGLIIFIPYLLPAMFQNVK